MPGALGGIDVKLAVSSGIPEAYTATVNALSKRREDMDPDIRRREDLLWIWLAEGFWAIFGYKPEGSTS